jgi:hypothetical protein
VGLAEGAASHAEYRASLDVTSQKIALVLELLRSDVDAIKWVGMGWSELSNNCWELDGMDCSDCIEG